MNLEMTHVRRNSKWSLGNPITLSIKESDEMQQIFLQLVLSRESRFYMMLLAFTSSLLMILNVAAFFIPVESGEKLSFSVTIFLAQTLNFATFAEMLPATSDNFPLFGIFMVNCIGIMCLTCVSSVVGQ